MNSRVGIEEGKTGRLPVQKFFVGAVLCLLVAAVAHLCGSAGVAALGLFLGATVLVAAIALFAIYAVIDFFELVVCGLTPPFAVLRPSSGFLSRFFSPRPAVPRTTSYR